MYVMFSYQRERNMKPFFVSIPHAGENVPDEVTWLKKLPEALLMCDVDRYVDELYAPASEKLGVPTVITDIHRYVVDANRLPDDIDQDSVEDSENPPGKFTTGYHWSQTTTEARLMKTPITRALHDELTRKYFQPFHTRVKAQFAEFRKAGHQKIYHLDAHSMPSKGLAAHRDPGGKRADIVIGDRDGTSCETWYKDLVTEAYKSVGFDVAYNWPYKGGRITETYGKPKEGQHTIQVEMNRRLYMDEGSKQKLPEVFADVEKKIFRALAQIVGAIDERKTDGAIK
jgi:N-formylglutamate deformylase